MTNLINIVILYHNKEVFMIPSNKAFDGENFYEYDGKTFYRWYHLEKLGEYQVRLKIISTKSNNLQGIAMFFSDFKGSISLNG